VDDGIRTRDVQIHKRDVFPAAASRKALRLSKDMERNGVLKGVKSHQSEEFRNKGNSGSTEPLCGNYRRE
jgi:hypothetical protein